MTIMLKFTPIPKSRGFSLIELMIAVTLGLLIMTAMVSLFVNTSRANRELAKVNSQIENGRFAMQLLQNEIVHGGFWGGFVPEFDDLTATGAPDDEPTAVPGVCTAVASWDAAYKTNLIGLPVQAYDDVPTGCSAIVTDKKANTDVIVIRHAATCLPGVGNCEGVKAENVYFQFSQCENEIGATPPLLYLMEQAPDDDDTSNFTLKKRGCTGTPPAATVGTQADVRKLVSHIYYIRDYAVTAGDGIPTLVRSEFTESGGTPAHQAAQPLINGIEGFRVELGIDDISDDGFNIITDASHLYTDAIQWADPDILISPQNRGDGSPDSYVRCPLADVAADITPPSTHPAATVCTAAQLTHVVAVKLYVLARAEQPTPDHVDNKVYNLGTTSLGPFNDAYKRHVFSTTVRLSNVSLRRETP